MSTIPNTDTTTYSVEYDPDMDEWVLTIGDYQETFDSGALAYLGLAREILADET